MYRDETGPECRRPSYAIRVRGVLDPAWSSWFAEMAIRCDRPGETVLIWMMVDQAALHGLLAKIRDLGLPLIAVRRNEPEEP